MNEQHKGMLAAFAAYTIFGLSFLFSKRALGVASPMVLLCVRFGVTLIALNLMVLFRAAKLELRGKKLGSAILLGLFQPVLYFILENYGLSYTTTSFAGMMSSVSPVLTSLLGVVMLRERPTVRQWIFIAASVAGVMLITLRPGGGQNTLVGCLCLVGAYFSGSVYTLLSRRLSSQFKPFDLTYVMFNVGFVFFACGAVVENGLQTPAVIAHALSHGAFVTGILFLSLASSVGAFLLINYALARLPVARAAVFNNLTALVSVLAGVLVMKDPFSPVSVVAFALILLGVWGVNRFAAE